MRLITLSLFLSFIFCSNSLIAQYDKGVIKESLSFQSKKMGEVKYSVYLPPSYDRHQRKYPVVYLLHGYTDNETAWVQFGEIDKAADKGIALNDFPEMVIVMPDAKVTWYVNDHKGALPFEDMFIEEFMPYINANYKVRANKESTGITGLSMGGYGSLLYAMKYPDLFVACAPLSAAIYTEEEVIGYSQDRWDQVEGPMYGKGLVGEARITEHWKENNPFYIANKMGKESLSKVKYWIDCGDDDFLYKGNSSFHILLKDMEVAHEYRVRDGKHNWPYWRTGIYDALIYIGDYFHRN